MVQQFESDLQKEIYLRFEESLKDFKELELEHSDLWMDPGYTRIFDIVIYLSHYHRSI